MSNDKSDHIDLTITTVDGARYSCTLEHDNPNDMTTLGNIQKWLQGPDDGGFYPFPVSEAAGPEKSWGKRTVRDLSNLPSGSLVMLSRRSISSVLLDNRQHLRASEDSSIAKPEED